MNEDELQPPGTEGGDPSSSRVISDPSKSPGPEESETFNEPVSIQPEDSILNLNTAAETASEIAAGSSNSRLSAPTHQQAPFYPPPGLNMPQNRMRYTPPLPPMMRPNFGQGPRHLGPYIPPGGSGSRFRQPHRSNVFSGAPQILKSDKIVSDSMIQAKPQIRYDLD
jgi:hypothetical protein